MRLSLLPGLILVSGMFFGSTFKLNFADELTHWLLYILLFLAGISVGSERVVISLRDLEIPFITMIGTLLSALLVSPFLGIPIKVIMSVASGFGWYTLAGPLITNLLGTEAGMLAFLSNLFRELISLALHRVIADRLGCEVLIACGGAASMDTFLPFVTEACGRDSGIKSFVSGLVLTLMTPIIITLFASYL